MSSTIIYKPKFCSKCNLPLTSQQIKNGNKFCSKSCGAIYSNARKDYSKIKTGPEKGYISPTQLKLGKTIYAFSHVSFNICGQCNEKYILSEQTKNVNNATKAFCSKECRDLHSKPILSEKARLNPNCGGKRNSVRIKYNGITLESSYELKVAQELDTNNIQWSRPKFVWYEKEGRKHRYHPDFYLPTYDVYLDPKNDYLIRIDSKKIGLVETQNNIRILVLNKNQLDWPSILKLI